MSTGGYKGRRGQSRQKRNQTHNFPRLARNEALLKPNDGLTFSRDQIQRLLLQFQQSDEIHNNYGHATRSNIETKSQYTLDIDQVCQLFPNILLNPKQNTPPISTTTNNTTMTSNDNELDGNESFQIAEEAEEKLNRIIEKVQSVPTLTDDILPSIQTLVIEEFDAVIDLWLQLSNQSSPSSLEASPTDQSTPTNNGQDQLTLSTTAIHRATQLLERWEEDYRKGLQDSMTQKEVDAAIFYIPSPSTRSYQNVINAWWRIYQQLYQSLSATTTTTSHDPDKLNDIRDRCTMLLDYMTNRLLAYRMHSVEYGKEYDEGDEYMYDTEQPLNMAYHQIIRMWIIPHNIPDHPLPLQESMKIIDRASTIIQQMEMYYHDVMSMPTLNEEQTRLLLTVYPERRTFNAILFAYCGIGRKHRHVQTIDKAADMLERMEERFTAYMDKGQQQQQQHHLEFVRHFESARPNLASYKSVLGAWSTMNTTSKAICDRAERLLSSMEDNPNIQPDCHVYHFVSIAWTRSVITSTLQKVEGAYRILKKLEHRYEQECRNMPNVTSDQTPIQKKNKKRLRPNRQCYNTVISACAHQASTETETNQVLKLLNKVYKEMIEKGYDTPDSSTYCHLFDGYQRLMSNNEEERDRLIHAGFQHCCQRGLLDGQVVSTMPETVVIKIPELKNFLVGKGQMSNRKLISGLPSAWTRRAKRRSQISPTKNKTKPL